MNIKYSGNMLTITSNIPVALFTQAVKLAPRSTMLLDETNKAVYTVSVGSGNFSHKSAAFNAVVEGKLAMQIPMPFNMSNDEAKVAVEETLGAFLTQLATHEDAIVASMTNALAPITAVIDSISFQ